jgi:TetR/AcrR family transcriptional regulator
MKRAQNDEQKGERRLSILSEAGSALDAQDYRDIRLQDLALRVGLVKGTFYRYFPTKQDLFMTLYMGELEEWLSDWSARSAGGEADPRRLEKILMDSLEGRTRLIRLIGSFPGDLEPELSDDGLRNYKRFMLGYLSRSAKALGPFQRGLGKKTLPFLISVFVLIQGAAPMCFPVARVAAMLREDEDLAVFRFEFRKLFPPLLRALIASYFPGA